jgi:hypothetical protein
MVEHWTVAPVVAGSIPVIHPKSAYSVNVNPTRTPRLSGAYVPLAPTM